MKCDPFLIVTPFFVLFSKFSRQPSIPSVNNPHWAIITPHHLHQLIIITTPLPHYPLLIIHLQPSSHHHPSMNSVSHLPSVDIIVNRRLKIIRTKLERIWRNLPLGMTLIHLKKCSPSKHSLLFDYLFTYLVILMHKIYSTIVHLV